MSVATAKPETLADLLKQLGDIPARRVRLVPAPGTATIRDVLRVLDQEKRLCELVDGVLVEKPMGIYESRLGGLIFHFLEDYLELKDLGIAIPADGPLRLLLDLVRLPDVSFISWAKLPNREIPAARVPRLVPDLAVEVVSEGNTGKEMGRKLREYFTAGVVLVWYIYPQTRTAKVYTAVDQVTELGETDTLDGGAVLPGFALPLKKLFDRAGRRQPHPRPGQRRAKPSNSKGTRGKRRGR